MDKKIIEGIWKAFQEVQEKKLSQAQKKHFDKDNDGDIDDADMALLNKKKKTDEASCGKDRTKNEAKTTCPKCDGKGCDHCDDKGYHTEEAELEEVKMGDTGWRKTDVRKDAQGNVVKTKNVAQNLAKKGARQASSLKKEESEWLSDLAAKLDEIEELSEKKDKHTKGATEPEGLLDKESPKSKEFVDQHKVDNTYTDFEEKGHKDASKAGRATKQSPARRGDNLSSGDKKATVAKEEVEAFVKSLSEEQLEQLAVAVEEAMTPAQNI